MCRGLVARAGSLNELSLSPMTSRVGLTISLCIIVIFILTFDCGDLVDRNRYKSYFRLVNFVFSYKFKFDF